MIFGSILLIYSVQHSLMENQLIKLVEIPACRSWLNFLYLSNSWFLPALTQCIVLLMSASSFWSSFTIPGDTFPRISIILLCILIFSFSGNCSCSVISHWIVPLISMGNCLPLRISDRTSQTTVYDMFCTPHFHCHWNYHQLNLHDGSKNLLPGLHFPVSNSMSKSKKLTMPLDLSHP